MTGASRWDRPPGSLPNGWKELRTPDMILFYVNEALGLSTWDRPGEPPKPNRSPAQSPASKSSKPKSAAVVKSASTVGAIDSTRAVIAPKPAGASKAAGGGMSKMFGKLGNARNIMKVAKLGMKLAEGDFEGAAESGLEGDEDGDEDGDDDEELDQEQEEEEVETDEVGPGEAGVDDSLSQPTQPFQQTAYHEQPMAHHPVSDQTAYVQPAYEQQAYEQPLYGQPVGEQPLYSQPVYEQPVYEQPMPLTQQSGFEHGQPALSPGQEGYPPEILQQNFQQQPHIVEHQVLCEQTTTFPPLHSEQPIIYEQTDTYLQSSYQQPTVPISSPEAYGQPYLPGGEQTIVQPQEILAPASIPEQPGFMEQQQQQQQQLQHTEGLTTAPLAEPVVITSGGMSQQSAIPMNFQGPLPPEAMNATCGPSEEPAPDQFQVYANPGSDMKALPSVSVIPQPDQMAPIVSIKILHLSQRPSKLI